MINHLLTNKDQEISGNTRSCHETWLAWKSPTCRWYSLSKLLCIYIYTYYIVYLYIYKYSWGNSLLATFDYRNGKGISSIFMLCKELWLAAEPSQEYQSCLIMIQGTYSEWPDLDVDSSWLGSNWQVWCQEAPGDRTTKEHDWLETMSELSSK